MVIACWLTCTHSDRALPVSPRGSCFSTRISGSRLPVHPQVRYCSSSAQARVLRRIRQRSPGQNVSRKIATLIFCPTLRHATSLSAIRRFSTEEAAFKGPAVLPRPPTCNAPPASHNRYRSSPMHGTYPEAMSVSSNTPWESNANCCCVIRSEN